MLFGVMIIVVCILQGHYIIIDDTLRVYMHIYAARQPSQGHARPRPGQAAAGQRSGQQYLPTGSEAKGKNVKSWLNTCI